MSRKLKLASSRSKKTSPSSVAVSQPVPSVEARLEKTRRLVILAMATANTRDPMSIGMDSEDLMAAVAATLSEVEQELFWLEGLSSGFLKLSAPDGDQAEAIARAAKGGAM